MPTLRWIHQPKSSASAASGGSSALSGRSAEAVPDTAVFSSASVVPAVSSKQSAEARSHAEILVDFQRLIEQARPDGGQKRKRTMSPSAKAAIVAKKKCKATSKRDLPKGVQKSLSGKRFISRIRWGGANSYIGTFDSPEHASAAYLSIKKDLVGANLLAGGSVLAGCADEANDLFEASRKRAVKAVGGVLIPRTKRAKTTSDRDLPTGVRKRSSKTFSAEIRWGGKTRYIGAFGTPEQASAAYLSVQKDLPEGLKLSALGADEVTALFRTAQKKAVHGEAVHVGVTRKKGLHQGFTETSFGKFSTWLWWGDKHRYIGTFDTPGQASAAYASMRKERDDIDLSALGADEVVTLFNAAQRKVAEAVGGFYQIKRVKALSERDLPKGVQKTPDRDLPTGVRKLPSGRFQAKIHCGGKNRAIGTFDTPEQASAAYIFVKEKRTHGDLAALGADEVYALLNAAKKKAEEIPVVGVVTPH